MSESESECWKQGRQVSLSHVLPRIRTLHKITSVTPVSRISHVRVFITQAEEAAPVVNHEAELLHHLFLD